MPTPKVQTPNSKNESMYVIPYIHTAYRGSEGDMMNKTHSEMNLDEFDNTSLKPEIISNANNLESSFK